MQVEGWGVQFLISCLGKGVIEKEPFRKEHFLNEVKGQFIKYKSPKAEACLVSSKISQEASVMRRE